MPSFRRLQIKVGDALGKSYQLSGQIVLLSLHWMHVLPS
uniref:Uncharacterized protein n=1 Tax=Arundo donax TaxID=35708 RepID=A0A0A9FWW3_ARUDO